MSITCWRKVTDLIKHLVVYPANMKRNLDLTGGLVYSQRLLLALIEKGAQRKESYEAVQRNAMASWKGAGSLQELVGKDAFISQHLKKSEIAACFNPKYYLRHVDHIFRQSVRIAAGDTPGRKGSQMTAVRVGLMRLRVLMSTRVGAGVVLRQPIARNFSASRVSMAHSRLSRSMRTGRKQDQATRIAHLTILKRRRRAASGEGRDRSLSSCAGFPTMPI